MAVYQMYFAVAAEHRCTDTGADAFHYLVVLMCCSRPDPSTGYKTGAEYDNPQCQQDMIFSRHADDDADSRTGDSGQQSEQKLSLQYVAHEDMEDATKAEKIQFALAGVEVNLLMAGICLILAMQSYQWSRTMFSVANVNVILAGVNLLPASGLDGESALSAACGINSISEVARKWLTNKKCRKKLLRAGLPGYACFCFFSVTMISKVILWLLIGLDVVLVFFNIF